MKPELQKTTHDAGDARAMKHLPSRAIQDTESWGGGGVEESKAGRAEPLSPSKIVTDVGHGAAGFDVCLPGFWSCFSSVFLYYAPFFPSGMVMNILC